MIIRHILNSTNAESPERHGASYVETDDFISDRLVLAADNMGYSVSLTTLKAGMCKTMRYSEHFETCYCISGEGTITNTATGEVHTLASGVLYALDQHDEHQVETQAGMTMLCIFHPALNGNEKHRPDGSYAAA